MTDETLAPPAELGQSGVRLWASVMDAYGLEVHEELLLLAACRAADRLDALAAELASGPVLTVNGKGDPVPHPALVESRAQALVLSRLLASLRLPSGETADGTLVRPQRRGGARGVYRPRVVTG